MTNNTNVSGTRHVIFIAPFTNYTCSVSATTRAGNGPPANVSGISDEDGECVL